MNENPSDELETQVFIHPNLFSVIMRAVQWTQDNAAWMRVRDIVTFKWDGGEWHIHVRYYPRK